MTRHRACPFALCRPGCEFGAGVVERRAEHEAALRNDSG